MTNARETLELDQLVIVVGVLCYRQMLATEVPSARITQVAQSPINLFCAAALVTLAAHGVAALHSIALVVGVAHL